MKAGTSMDFVDVSLSAEDPHEGTVWLQIGE